MIALITRCLLLGWTVAGLVVPCPAAHAQRVPTKTLRVVRDQLREYEPAQAIDALGTLTRLVAGEERLGPHDRAEARFLRAITAADLLLLSGRPGWGHLESPVARALGVPLGSLRAHLDGEFRALEHGRFGPLVADARAALAFGAGDAPAEARGPRLDLQRLSRVTAAFGADDPAALLAPLASDPCAAGGCEPVLEALSERSRRSVAAFRSGLAAAARLDLAREFGDPFSRAVDEEIEHLTARLTAARLSVKPRPEPGLGVVEGRADADVFVTITESAFVVQSSVTYGLAGGELRPVSPKGCGERVEVPLPSKLGARVVAVEALARALPRGCGGQVGIAAEDSVSAHLVLRVLETVRGAGLRFAGLAGVDASGELAVHQMEMAHAGKRAQIGVTGPHLFIDLAAGREQFPLEALAAARAEELGRVARLLAAARLERPLRVAGDVPFLALRVILRALHGAL